jgi:hypothetical protein
MRVRSLLLSLRLGLHAEINRCTKILRFKIKQCLILLCGVPCSLIELLTKLGEAVDTSGTKTILNVVRCDVLDGASRALGRPNYNPSYPLNVKFVGEDGIDEGGLTRFATALIASASRI